MGENLSDNDRMMLEGLASGGSLHKIFKYHTVLGVK
jgi:hypothetical protein